MQFAQGIIQRAQACQRFDSQQKVCFAGAGGHVSGGMLVSVVGLDGL